MKDLYKNRRFLPLVLLVLISLTYLARLFYIQVVDDRYRVSAENNVLRYVTQYPARGLVYDRDGRLLVSNQAAYDLMVIPAQCQEMDTLSFCDVLEISPGEFRDRFASAVDYSRRTPSIFLKQLSAQTYARLQETLYKYPGFYVQTRTLRKYEIPVAGHVLGYVGEVGDQKVKEDPYYKSGDYIGISGIEKSYESYLRGKKGMKIYMVDVHNQVKGEYMEGRYDTAMVVGDSLILTLDAELQAYGEKLMANKVGSIVALEPKTGEVLSLVSTPAYDPSLLVGRIRSANFMQLFSDTLKPLFNRALMAQYPPGSTFKTINGLIGLQEGVLTPGMEYYCDNGYYAGNLFVGCHFHVAPLNLREAVMHSCNTYFCHVFRNIIDRTGTANVYEGYTHWRNHLLSFGLGKKLGSDFTNELSGFIPETSYYDRYYGSGGWRSLTIISMAIGQGELLITPLQMANMTASIANRGYYITPHILKGIEGVDTLPSRYKEKHHTTIDSAYYEVIVDGMKLAVNEPLGSGATAWRARLNDIEVAGKTGTAQNENEEDHSIFIAFAPADDPQIALAVYVERGGFGNTYAAPIAGLMIEKYLRDTISNTYMEKYVLDANLIEREEEP